MADDRNRNKASSILGDINPIPAAGEPDPHPKHREGDHGDRDEEDIESMERGSQPDSSRHSGSRDVTTGTGGDVGGTRNYRSGTGATGSDLGNRPE
jgi:hypothetical protein